MRQIAVSYGPPARQGVQSIMGLGADEIDALTGSVEKTLTTAGWISIGVFLLGVISNKKQMRAMGIGGAAVALGVKYVALK